MCEGEQRCLHPLRNPRRGCPSSIFLTLPPLPPAPAELCAPQKLGHDSSRLRHRMLTQRLRCRAQVPARQRREAIAPSCEASDAAGLAQCFFFQGAVLSVQR